MKNVTESKKEKKAVRKETVKNETNQILANIKKAEKENASKPLVKVVQTAKTKTTTTADNATIKVVKEIKRENKTREKNFIYKFQLEEKKRTAKEEKRLRGKLRRGLQSIVNDIIIDNAKKKNFDNVPAFIKFYKENYILNDFSLQSITNSADELKQQDLNKVLLLVKEYKEKK